VLSKKSKKKNKRENYRKSRLDLSKLSEIPIAFGGEDFQKKFLSRVAMRATWEENIANGKGEADHSLWPFRRRQGHRPRRLDERRVAEAFL
jgi:hypothetical protein